MTLEPGEEHIQSIIDVTELSRPQAIVLLKNYNNDTERAISAYFDDSVNALRETQQPQQEQSAWPENSSYHGPENRPSFRIDADETQTSSTAVGLSRPPSRTSYRGGEPIDLTAEHAAADASQSLTLEEQEAQDLKAAIEASQNDQFAGQENGVTGSGQQFGPASAAHYDQRRWALTVTNPTVLEVVGDPLPEYRKRKEGEPAFLRPSKHSDHFPALLTIYHAIPLAREALLLPHVRHAFYEHNSHWWSGTQLQKPRVVSSDGLISDQSDRDEYIKELQRLMAFLDGTSRAYGSADTLMEYEYFRAPKFETKLPRLIETWKSAAMNVTPDEQLTQVFSSAAYKDPRVPGIEPSNKEFVCLEPIYQPDHDTIYDPLDSAVWDDNPTLPMDDVWIHQVAEIFTIRLHDSEKDPERRQKKVDIRIPAVWYPDRYMESCREISAEMRQRKLDLQKDIDKCKKSKDMLTLQKQPNGKFLNIRDTLLAGADAASQATHDHSLPNGESDDLEPLASGEIPITSSQASMSAGELREMVERIDRKLQILEEHKAKAVELYRQASQQLTQPSVSAFDPPNHKYTLRGVSTRPDITYVLQPVVQDLIDLEEEGRPVEERSEWQWWRISFSPEDSQQPAIALTLGPPTQAEVKTAELSAINASGPYSDWSRKVSQPVNDSTTRAAFAIRKVREFEVLKAAREEGNDVLLVYANENAVNFKGSKPSAELQAFVEADNRAFNVELHGQPAALMAAEDLIDDEDMQPIMAASPKRDAEEQPPSPSSKRNKGSDERMGMTECQDEPPPHQADGSSPGQEMQERTNGTVFTGGVRPNRIGEHAEMMMDRVDEADEEEAALRQAEATTTL